MKSAMTLTQLAERLEADQKRMRDVAIDTRKMNVITSEEGGTTLHLTADDGTQIELDPAQHFHRGLGTELKVRAELYDRLRVTHPALYDNLINGLLNAWSKDHDGKDGRRMIRTYTDGGADGLGLARSIHSDRYRRIDNYPVVRAILPVLGKIPGVQIEGEVTETRMYIKAIVPNTQFDLQSFIDPSKHVFLPEGNPDYVQAGVVITNSEVGNGALKVQKMLYRLVCRNGMIVAKALTKAHIGKNVEVGDDGVIYRDETVQADDKAFLMKVQDAVQTAVDDTAFEELARQFAETTSGEKIAKPIEAMKVLQPMVGLSDGERDGALTHLLKDGDLSKFGAINAITRMAQDVESYDRSVELEEAAGAKVMDMPVKDWERVATAA